MPADEPEFNVCNVVQVLYPDVINTIVADFSRKLAERGHNVSILTWNKNRRASLERLGTRCMIFRLRGLNFPFSAFQIDNPFLPNLPFNLVELRSEIVHVHSHLFLTSLEAVAAAKLTEKPTVTTLHGFMAERGAALVLGQKAYLRTLGRWVLANSDRIHCLTRNDAQQVASLGVSSRKIKIIPNGVDTTIFSPSRDPRTGTDNILWVGRFVSEKGLEYLARAAEIVAKQCPNVRFIMLGDGPTRPRFEAMVSKSGLRDRFTFKGAVRHEEVAYYMHRCELLVLPSLREGLPTVVLEAMACGLPVIAWRIAGVDEIIVEGETGRLVRPLLCDEFAHAICDVLMDKKLKVQMGRAARSAIEQKYSWEVVIERFEELYQELKVSI